MKYLFYSFSVFFLMNIIHSLKAQTVPFELVFGDSNINEKGIASLQLPDGSILMVGNTDATENGNSEISLTKFSAEGQFIWSETYGTPNHDYANNAVITQDGKIAIVAESHTIVGGNADGMVLLVDMDGSEIWLNFFGEEHLNESFYSIDKTNDNGVIICGFITGEGFGNDHFVAKISQNGEMVWSKSYGSQKNEIGVSIKETLNGDFIFVGDKQQENNAYGIEAFRLDKNGDIIWQLDINGFENGGCKNMLIDSRGDCVIVGEAVPKKNEGFDILLVKIDAQGGLIWEKFIDGTEKGDAGFDLMELDAGGYMVAGYGFNAETQQTDVVVSQVNIEGENVEIQYFGGLGFDIGYDIIPSIEGGYYVTGSSYSETDNQYFLVHNYPLSVGIEDKGISGLSWTVYPNPLSDATTLLQLDAAFPLEKVVVSVFDSKGILVFNHFYNNLQNILLPAELNSGTYILQLAIKNDTFYKKIIVR
ncbi:MAG: T9SS type A sorting domain-containing protein [Chitinophagales bacterium]